MLISSTDSFLYEIASDWLIVGACEDEPLAGTLAELDSRLDGMISRLKERGDLTGKLKELTPILDVPGLGAPRLLIVGYGPRDKATRESLATAAAAAARSLTSRAIDHVVFALDGQFPSVDAESSGVAIGTGFVHGSEGPGLRKSKPSRFVPKELCLAGSVGGDMLRTIASRVDVESRAVSLARELVNLPPCDKYPDLLAERARAVSQAVGLECEIFDEHRLAEERMNVLLAVARGSDRPARFVVLRHHGGGDGPWLGLVGKGVTFDSGGLSLKTTDQMVDMKCDMAGAATVLAAMQAIAESKLPVNVLGIMALVENLPSGKAMMLGDVLTARNGKTIEVLNTDAEGRLILADALCYAVDQKAAHLVDLATLTGACMIALGSDVAGLMSNNDDWADRVSRAARTAGEKAWPLPMFPHYGEMIKGQVADIRNTGGTRYAGAITAAKFLEEFVAEVPWVHLDIAGPAFAEKDSSTREAGGTGCFVRTLIELARMYPT